MITIFRVFDGGQDGTDGSFICAVLGNDLAERVALNQGSMGVGSGYIEKVIVAENFDELPDKIKKRIIKDEESEQNQNKQLMDKLTDSFSTEEITRLGKLLSQDTDK
jgi:hypothetical protein